MKKKLERFKTPMYNIKNFSGFYPDFSEGIFFVDGYVYNTNGHVITRQKMSLFKFNVLEIELLNGKYITKKDWKLLSKATDITISKGNISGIIKGKEIDVQLVANSHYKDKIDMMLNIIDKNLNMNDQLFGYFHVNFELLNMIKTISFSESTSFLIVHRDSMFVTSFDLDIEEECFIVVKAST